MDNSDLFDLDIIYSDFHDDFKIVEDINYPEVIDIKDDKYEEFLLATTNILKADERLKILSQMSEQLGKPSIHIDFLNVLKNVVKKRIKSFSTLESLERALEEATFDEWFKNFIPDKKKREQLTIELMSEDKKYTIVNLNQLFQMRKEQKNKYLVQELFAYGSLFLLVAKPKTGKSLFSTSLAVNVAIGGDFLKRKCEKQNVLFIQNEENLPDTGDRIKGHGLEKFELENPELYKELINSDSLVVAKDLDIAANAKLIFDIVEKKNIKLVIIDSLGASIREKGYTEFSPELLGVLYNLQITAQNNGIVILIVHHATKGDDNTNRANMSGGIAGSNAIVRANDGFIKMQVNQKDDKLVDIYFNPRNSNPLQIQVRYEEGEAMSWEFEVTKESSMSIANIELQNDILRLLYEQFNIWVENKNETQDEVYGLSLSEIMSILKSEKKETIARLNFMLKTEGISKRIHKRQHIYHINRNGESWLYTYILEEDERRESARKLEEAYSLVADNLRNCLTAKEIDDLISDLSVKDRNAIFKKLNKEEKERIMLLRYPSKFNIGDKVEIINVIDCVYTISKISYDLDSKESKNMIKEDRHLYYLEELEDKTFYNFQLKIKED